MAHKSSIINTSGKFVQLQLVATGGSGSALVRAAARCSGKATEGGGTHSEEKDNAEALRLPPADFAPEMIQSLERGGFYLLRPRRQLARAGADA